MCIVTRRHISTAIEALIRAAFMLAALFDVGLLQLASLYLSYRNSSA